jgi:biopolymer transport protein ExbD
VKFKRRRLDVIPPYVSMADIAFNLVLFFLMLAKTQDDSHIEWQPASDPRTKQIANAKVSIMVDGKGGVYLNGQRVSTREPQALGDLIAKELGELPPGERTVLLKVDKNTLASTFEPIMEAVGIAGGDAVHVLEQKR